MNRAFRLCLLLCAVAPHGAWAHAALRVATPPAGARLPAAPTAIVLVFSEKLEVHFSSVVVTDAAGARVDRADLKAAQDDTKSITEGLNVIGAGTYQVTWHVVSADTHKSQGSYRFTIGP